MISASDSSFSTQSPSFLSQDPTVPSETDSPSRGIFTCVGIYYSFVYTCMVPIRIESKEQQWATRATQGSPPFPAQPPPLRGIRSFNDVRLVCGELAGCRENLLGIG